MSTFAQLIDRVETSNSTLESIRETIINESVDSTISIIDAVENYGVRSSQPGALDSTLSTEDMLEDDRDRLQQTSFLESAVFYLQGIYQAITGMRRDQQDEGLFEFASGAVVGGVVGATIGGGDDKGDSGRSMLGMAQGLMKRLLGLIGVGFVVNELMRFFFDKSIGDIPKMMSEWLDKKFEEIGNISLDDLRQIDWGKTFNDLLDSAIRMIFGEGTLESSLKQAGIYGSIGFLVAGPMGGIIGTVFGLITGAIKEDDVISLKDQIYEGLKDTVLAFWQMTFGDFGTEAAKVKYNSLKNNLQAKVAEGSVVETSPGVFELTERGRTVDPGAQYLVDEYNKIGGSGGKDSAMLNQIQEELNERLADLDVEGTQWQNQVGHLEKMLSVARKRAQDAGKKFDYEQFMKSGIIQTRLSMIQEERQDVEELQDQINKLRQTESSLMQNINASTDQSSNLKQNITAVPSSVFETAKRSR